MMMHIQRRFKSFSNPKDWIERQRRDPFVKLRTESNYRSRAAFKLLDLQSRFALIAPSSHVLDLGAFPGSWSQVASKITSKAGSTTAVDIRALDPIPNVTCITGSYETIHNRNVIADVVLSDMAHDVTGNILMDVERILELARGALEVAERMKASTFACKIYQGMDCGGF
jgi:23S rRNA (uridine2552-2'-O)-methyltransferase